ncbi:hypothetical protein SBADM41S_02909 [Streptomyces badius]
MPFDTGGQNGKGTVRIDIEPGRTGSNDLHVWIDGSDGRPMDVPEVKLALTLESKDIGPLPVVRTGWPRGTGRRAPYRFRWPGTGGST